MDEVVKKIHKKAWGQVLREVRTEVFPGQSLNEFARLFGKSNATISKWENGINTIGQDDFTTLMDFMKYPTTSLMSRVEKKLKENK